MIPQSYTFSRGFCLNNLLQVWLIGNQIYLVPRLYILIRLIRCIFWLEKDSARVYEILNEVS